MERWSDGVMGEREQIDYKNHEEPKRTTSKAPG
jgi:hypothetical protein